jgi:carbohydrate-selective porin OprB
MTDLFAERQYGRLGGLLILVWLQASYGQTTQPVAEGAPEVSTVHHKAYDPWTSKQLTGDWAGLRTDLADVGVKLDLSYQQQFQQNFRGGLDTHNAHRF